jgi:membrane-bound lytic murein transglycosylase D
MEELVLTMKKTRSTSRPFFLSASALACALLSACSTVWEPDSRAGSDVDRLLKASPSASAEASEVRMQRGETRHDPKSGLQVDVRPATLSPATASASASAPAAPGKDGASSIAAAVTADVAEEVDPKDVIGSPTDPLRPEDVIDLEDAEASQDLWARIRRGFNLPPLESNLVQDHLRWYGSRPEYVQRMTERASRYLFHIVDEVERRQMPMELALLPFIESAFNPQAMSSARASGMWQFMPATGKDFELKQNLFRDDRRDVLASTRAALDYLARLNRQFGDWHLALAAYNWGEGNVQRAIRRNERLGLPTDYINLNMPLETRNYLPKLHAVKHIVLQPESFNLVLTPIENHPYFVSVPIQRDIDSALASRLAGLSLDEFKALNPSLNKPVILAAGTPQILLPYDNASQFVHNLGNHKGTPLATWTAWVVPRTMRPAEAAKKIGMSEATLRDVNRIPPRMLIKAGSALLVHRSAHREQEDVSEALADNAVMALAPDMPAMRRKSIRAGKHDTVASIARRYRVSAQQVAQWNRTSASATFKRGQAVVIYVPGKSVKKLAARKPQARRVSSERSSVRKPRVASNRSSGKARGTGRRSKMSMASMH